MLACPKCCSVYTKEIEFCGLDGSRLEHFDSDPMIGRTLERFEISDLLGQGGMARVYQARHTFLDQVYAIKVLHGEFSSDRALAKRFRREAQALSRIKHRNVVPIADFGVSYDGLVFMAMEFVNGPPLSEIIRNQGVFSHTRAVTLVKKIADGLAAAHECGFIHRDLKPLNIMVVGQEPNEEPVILDFGLVGILDNANIEHSDLTAQGQFFGTPAYMSPEQVSGKDVGLSSDLYSLGIIFYQLLAGSVPFVGDVKQLAYQQVHDQPERPATVGDETWRVISGLLEKDPARRYQNAGQLIAALEGLPEEEAPAAPTDLPSLRPEPHLGDVLIVSGDQLSDRDPSRVTRPPTGHSLRTTLVAASLGALALMVLSILLFGENVPGLTEQQASVVEPLDAGGQPKAPPLAKQESPPPQKTVEAPPEKPKPTVEAPKKKETQKPPPAKEKAKPLELRIPKEKNYAALHQRLTQELRTKDLELLDLRPQVPHLVGRWRDWGSGHSPPYEALKTSYIRLLKAVDRTVLNQPLLRRRIRTIREAIDDLPTDSPKAISLENELQSLADAVERKSFASTKHRLSRSLIKLHDKIKDAKVQQLEVDTDDAMKRLLANSKSPRKSGSSVKKKKKPAEKKKAATTATTATSTQ